MSLTSTWTDELEAESWPQMSPFQRGELVRARGVDMLHGRTGVITGYRVNDSGHPDYYVLFEGEPVGWVMEQRDIEGTGVIDLSRLPHRVRPVLGNSTVLRILEASHGREQMLFGRVVVSTGLYHLGDEERPRGYSIRLPWGTRAYSVPFGSFEVVTGVPVAGGLPRRGGALETRTWIGPLVPDSWPSELTFRWGEVVRTEGEDGEVVGIVEGYDESSVGRRNKYVVRLGREGVICLESHLESTGVVQVDRLCGRRPVPGDGTVVRVLDSAGDAAAPLAGAVVLTQGLYPVDSDEPLGYLVRSPTAAVVREVPFGSFDVVTGYPPEVR